MLWIPHELVIVILRLQENCNMWIFVHFHYTLSPMKKNHIELFVATPLWGKCEHETRTPKSGNLESSGTPAISELDCRGQDTSPWGVLYIFGKFLKFRCRKWPRMSHLDICSISYGQKKGQESNWQFDPRPLKIGNRPNPGVCKWSATHRWKSSWGELQVWLRPCPN
jgi:hypothetical protein